MIEALLAGGSSAEALADLARGRLRSKLPALREALDGRVDATHRIRLCHLLDLIDFLQDKIDQMSSDIDEYLRPYEPETRTPHADPWYRAHCCRYYPG